MRSIAIVVIGLLFAVSSFAQTRVVRGKLTTFNKIPVQHVELSSKKAKSTAMTDSLGQFELVCNEKDVIVIKARVFQALRKKVNPDDDYISANLIFRDTPKNRDIVTDLAYITPEQLTFGLAHRTDENNEYCNYLNMYELLKVKYPGLVVAEITGNYKVYLRGTVNGHDEVLFIVDGSPWPNVGGLQPCCVKSIDLKIDGMSSMYGTRGDNGVILIETSGATD
jgi:hypothetical protein